MKKKRLCELVNLHGFMNERNNNHSLLKGYVVLGIIMRFIFLVMVLINAVITGACGDVAKF